jgi:hypothetical protein
MVKPSFHGLWNAYPLERSPCDGPWENQCAIRLSLAFNAEKTIRVNKQSYTEPKCAHGHARGAESLVNWLWRHHLGRPTILTSGHKAKLSLRSKTGIIFFKDCFTRSGQSRATGDHIDLWNAGLTKGFNDPENRATQIWFWSLT